MQLRGVVLRELPIEKPSKTGASETETGASEIETGESETGEGETGNEDDATPTGSGSASEGPEDELPPVVLEPPEPGTCEVRAWQKGRRVAASVGCDAKGAYELELEPGVVGTVSVELLIPGHLRGLIDVEVPEGLTEATRVIDVPTVALGLGFRVAGQTVDGRGQPLSGVHVQAMPRPDLGETEPWRTESDAQGRFELSTLPYGPVSLRAIKEGFALSVVEAVSPEEDVLLILDALIDLEGEVIADASLIAKAKVRLEGSSVWPALERPLAADGRFVFEDLADGIYGVEVQVLAEQPGDKEWASVPLENVTPDLRVSLALIEAHRVPVRVVDPEGNPIPKARVILGYGELGMLQKIAETDTEGRARVGPVVPGPYFVRADADGYLPAPPVELEVDDKGFTGEPPTLVLIRPARIEGVVVDEHDRPVPGAEVLLDSEVEFSLGEGESRARLFASALEADRALAGAGSGSLGVTEGKVPDIPLFGVENDEQGIGTILADSDGNFVLDGLLPGSHAVWAIDGEHAASAVERMQLKSGEVRVGVRLRLREGVPLTGVVRTSNRQPISGVQVDLGDGLVLMTDDRGVFDAGFRRGHQQIVLRGPGLIPRVIDVELDDRPIDVEIVLEPARGRYEGRVVDGNGQPIADVEVELRPLDGLSPSVVTWTDARGVYELDELTPGMAEIHFEHGAYVPADRTAKIDEQLAGIDEIVLDSGWVAEVLVRAAGRGDPIDDARLSAGHVSASTDAKGQATLTRLLGTVELLVSAEGWIGQTITLRDDGSGRIQVTVELEQGGSIEGTIDDDIGDPVSGATIEIRSLDGEVLGEARSDARGHWRIDGVPEGDVRVLATPPAALSAVLAPVEERSDVLRGEVTTDVQLRFERP